HLRGLGRGTERAPGIRHRPHRRRLPARGSASLLLPGRGLLLMIGWLLCLLACAQPVEEVPEASLPPAQEEPTTPRVAEAPRFLPTRLADAVALGDCEAALALIP